MLFQGLDVLVLQCKRFGPTEMYLRPDAFHRIQHEQITNRLALRHHETKARKIVLHLFVLFVPCRLMQNAGRVVALGFSAHSVPRKMVTAQVDAQQRLPVAHCLVPRKRHLPAGAAV